MAALKQIASAKPIKMLLIGDSGAGKTGSLASLAAAGYRLRIADSDKGSDILANLLMNPQSPYFKTNPKAGENVDIISISDSMKGVGGVLKPSKALGWKKLTDILMDWRDAPDGPSLGPVTSWGPQDVLVLDSLSGLATLAFNHHLQLNGKLQQNSTQNEHRRDIGSAQNYIKSLLELLYDDAVKCNVIVISHVTTVTEAGGAPKIEEGNFVSVPAGYPSAIGRALSPHIPRFFNNMVVMRATVQGPRAVHKIYTKSQNLGSQILMAKTQAPLKVKAEYGIENGMAELFADLKAE